MTDFHITQPAQFSSCQSREDSTSAVTLYPRGAPGHSHPSRKEYFTLHKTRGQLLPAQDKVPPWQTTF